MSNGTVLAAIGIALVSFIAGLWVCDSRSPTKQHDHEHQHETDHQVGGEMMCWVLDDYGTSERGVRTMRMSCDPYGWRDPTLNRAREDWGRRDDG